MLIGIVGKPSSGKSTFFRAATLAEAEIANYPFTTIKPNHGVGFVKVRCVDREFEKQCNPRVGYCVNGWRFVPVDMLDVAGLVPGAHEGRGMGNQFLDDLRQADVLIHVVDVAGATNEKGEPVEPLSYDPAKDIDFLEVEIDMWYLSIIQKNWERFARQIIQEKKDMVKALAKQLSAFKVTEEMVKLTIAKLNLNREKPNEWDTSNLKGIATELRKMTKPMIVACNKIDIEGADRNFERLKKQFPNHMLIPCSAESELALREAAKKGLIDYLSGEGGFEIRHPEKLSEKQRLALEFIKKAVLNKFRTTGIQDVLNKAVFELLEYIAVFPGGVSKLEDSEGRVLPDCFLLPGNSTALDFAYHIHTDLGEHFIRAIDVKTKRAVGKDYKLKNRDVIEIITGK